MARVEITQSVGPEVITSINQNVTHGTTNLYSTMVDVSRYTLHSYHVVTDKAITFTILGSNVASPGTIADWVTISTHGPVTTPAWNTLTLAYSDTWNFKYSQVLIANSSGSTAAVKVHEKHNA